MRRRRRRFLVVLAAALVLAPPALADGGTYVVDGGTRAEQAQVKAALDASAFDFGVVPGPVLIHVRRGADSHAAPGEIWLDADLLDAGRFSWGVVQHEYAHQVDFALLDDAGRAQLHPLLGGAAWWSGAPHAQLDSERFADLVSWAYWPSPDNVLKPGDGEQVDPAAFRAALARLLPPRPAESVRITAAAKRKRHPRNG